ncbi:MAG: cobalamin-dependent protein, partial [Candidatus Methanomethylicia archaeon]
MVDFLFVNQPRYKGLPVPREIDCSSPQKDNFMSPTGLMYIAGSVRDLGYSLKLIDANVLNMSYKEVASIIKKENPRCVVGSMTAPTIYHDNKLAKITKKNSNAYYGTWGAIPSALRDFMYKKFPDLDFILENEPELTFKELAQNIMKNKKNPFLGVKGLSYRKGKKYVF